MDFGAAGLSCMPAGSGEVPRRVAGGVSAGNVTGRNDADREPRGQRVPVPPSGASMCDSRRPGTRPQSAVSPPFGTFDHAACPGSGDHTGRFAFAVSITTR